MRDTDDHEEVRDPAPDALTAYPQTGEVREIVYDWDLGSDVITWSGSLSAILGDHDPRTIATGIGYASLLEPSSPASRYEAVMAPGGYDGGGGVSYKAIYGLNVSLARDATPVWIEDCGRWFADAGDRPARAHGVIRVVNERFAAERVAAAAGRDLFSCVSSPADFLGKITKTLNRATRVGSTFAVMAIGLRLRAGRDEAADATFAEAFRLMRLQMRSKEAITWQAPDVISVLLEPCDAGQAAVAAARFIDAMGDIGAAVDVRVGAMLAPAHGRPPRDLVACAERALESAWQPGAPVFVRFEPDAARSTTRRVNDGAADVLAALDEERVVLAFQPIVEAKTRAILSYEALVRIKKSDGTLMLPDVLMPAAEANGLVALIDRRVLELTFAVLAGHRQRALSIKTSVASLRDRAWQDQLRNASKLRPDAGRRLTIEVTEKSVLADLKPMCAILAAIKRIGVKVVLGDFGSGQSSLASLRQLPIDCLKIDGAFAQNLGRAEGDRYFIRTLIDQARNLRIPTIAGWVEDDATAAMLADWGVEYLQGDLFGTVDIGAQEAQPRRAVR